MGFASGGTAPGFVVMALKWLITAKADAARYTKHSVSPAAPIRYLTNGNASAGAATGRPIRGGSATHTTANDPYACSMYVIEAHKRPQQSRLSQDVSNGPVPHSRRSTV
eukprot:CAMPEP_0194349870 /NCGR_PEP_ID=MMETSP0171-20130528/107329_1 /TAXON_ID=218684 /ORGANISM="Corethron pennatum, Strain L29A3" /LENGTH=108 /DNA_ID=CAMNT_0039117369 /DNA_START=1402 /DNA_END=1725 /DNA_ORIENTATION=+